MTAAAGDGAPVIAFRPVAGAEAALAGLPAAERALLPPAATARRRFEFAAGRAAARAAVDRLLRAPGACAAVLRDAGAGTAQPVALDARGARLPAYVSITHTEGVAAAAAFGAPVGLDLVRVEALDGAFRREAFWPEELRAFERALGEPRAGFAACAAFGAKEAVVKWLGTGLTVPLRAVRLSIGPPAPPERLGGLRARRFALALEGPVRAALRAWIGAAGPYLLVAVTSDAPVDPLRSA
ncbi:4'-phosphopantetheinyl transferase [Anaeromyxobacter dehalogenans 2CP-1]|uniref:4'-phosphopantetheinyl transferase n=1 Tax=Anaeromyxobacter dehalogenans (strain ATCC BAA-258 / DSM 21875 / 2CP-1) TaxID=455488 RepID=B8J9H0_ANAD2|nr:4'-phosphopantetheinyl transferase superfamily protein [Anaeromyxobacter dehalogenans]ACL67358.1 4'-phosphopantetheinyl transferase [Anaeromyxobacter dehalogenans 2CP-1]